MSKINDLTDGQLINQIKKYKNLLQQDSSHLKNNQLYRALIKEYKKRQQVSLERGKRTSSVTKRKKSVATMTKVKTDVRQSPLWVAPDLEEAAGGSVRAYRGNQQGKSKKPMIIGISSGALLCIALLAYLFSGGQVDPNGFWVADLERNKEELKAVQKTVKKEAENEMAAKFGAMMIKSCGAIFLKTEGEM